MIGRRRGASGVPQSAAFLIELPGVRQREKQFIGEPQRQTGRRLRFLRQRRQEQIRLRLADTLRWVVSQRLVPKNGGGRHAMLEIMGSNLRTKETIVQGEAEGKTFYEIIESSNSFGWRTFDSAAVEAFEQGIITEETAMLYCSKRGPVTRAIDNMKKSRGESTSGLNGLRMKPAAVASKNGPPAIPATLKLK